MRLRNKIAVITGGGSGIGRRVSETFAKEGAHVAIIDYSKQAAEEVAHEIQENGGEAIVAVADVSRSNEVERAFQLIESHYKGIHVLMNNAGIFPANDGSVLEVEEEIWDRVMAINLKGVYLCSKNGIPLIRKSGGGSVIHMGSISAFVGCTVPQDAYTASKGGIIALTRSMAVQFAKDKIRVNAICPGPIETSLTDNLLSNETERIRRLTHIPIGRFGRTEDIAGAAVYFASEESSYVTGTALTIDGGLTINYF
jgi:NAD(P)-dependent dehydrogenase (short-subunit alcohol dehydrogenase family)